jgi:uncharacterized repeat protein (TIGR01451 family)
VVAGLPLAVTAAVDPTPGAAAGATIDSVGFKAPVHTAYDHATGGGAWNDGSVTYVKGELLATNYACGDIATYMLELDVADSPSKQPPPYTARVVLEFTLDSTGRSGVALMPLTAPQHLRVNSGVIAAPGVGTGPGGSDGGFLPSGGGLTTDAVVAGSPAPFVTSGPLYTPGSVATLTFWVEGLGEGTRTIVRSDAQILCQADSNPTGNLQAVLKSVTVVDPPPNESAGSGNQTVNFRGVGDLAGLSAPALGVVKTVAVGDVACPATPSGVTSISTPTNPLTVTYCYYVSNYAAVSALGVTLVDDRAGAGTIPITLTGLTDEGSGTASDLAGGGATATGRYSTTLSGGGRYVNTATADADNATAAAATTATVVIQSGVVLNKTVTLGSCPSSTKSLSLVNTGAAQTVRYCFRITNYTGAPAFNVALTDDQAGAGTVSITLSGLTDQGSGSAVDLAAGASAFGELVRSLPGSGTVLNTATAAWDTTLGGTRETTTSTATVAFASPTPAVMVAKVQTSDDPTAVGQNIVYTILATNTGNTVLTGVTVTDPNATITSCSPAIPVASLAAGASIECQARHTVTQSDVDAGQVVNAAVVTGTGPDGVVNAVTDTSADVVTPIAASPALETTKIRTSAVPDSVGDVISYTIKARNTGNVTLSAVTIVDPNATIGTCVPTIPTASLAPNAEITCVATHVVTQAEVDAGRVANTATATGTAPGGPSGGVTDPSEEVITPVAQTPELTVTKTRTSGIPNAVGAVITYTIRVENTGNTKLNDVDVDDPNATIGSCTEDLPLDDFMPGSWFTCSATHTVTRADMNLGEVRNTATAEGTAPGGPAGGVDGRSNEVVTPVTQGPGLAITKTRSSAAPTKAGDVVTYTLLATNVGNVDLTSVVVTDPNAAITSCTPSNPVAVLAPDATITCSATHVVSQVDMDAGQVVSRAFVAGTAPGGTPGGVTGASLEIVDPLETNPELTVTKTRTSSVPTSVGALIHYTIQVRNTGDVTLTSVNVTDPSATISSCTPTVPVAALAPGGVVTCLASHTVTQGDLDNGQVANTAAATGTAPGGPPGGVTDPSNTVVTPVDGVRELTVTKTRTSGVPREVGDVITYSIVATNSGTVTLSNVRVTDANASISSCSPVTPVATLAPGASITCTASRTVTAGDVSAGRVENIARAIGTPPGGPIDGVEDPSPKEITPVATGPAIEIVKSRTSGVPAAVGEVVTYALVVTNMGDVTLTNVTVTDPNATIDTCTPPLPVASLVPGGAFICTASHTVTAGDVTAGLIENTASAAGTRPGGPAGGVTDTSNAVVTPVANGPELTVKKRRTSGIPSAVGDVVTYSIVAMNTGNVALSNVTVTDSKVPIGVCTPVAPVASLAPGVSITCSASYAITQADIDAGQVLNTATARGTPPGGSPGSVVGTDDNTTEVTRRPGLETTITGPNPAPRTPGEIVFYTVKVRNTGNTTIDGVVPQGKGLNLSSCIPTVPAKLLPGQEIVCQASHTVSTTEQGTKVVEVSASAAGINSGQTIESNVALSTSYLPGGGPSGGSGVLAFTGRNSGWLALTGAAAVALGLLLVLAVRRRRHA